MILTKKAWWWGVYDKNNYDSWWTFYQIKLINQKAKQLNVNLEDLIVKLIHDQMKSDQNGIELIQYHDLDSLAGTWSKKEADEFLQAIDKFNQVDESLWQ